MINLCEGYRYKSVKGEYDDRFLKMIEQIKLDPHPLSYTYTLDKINQMVEYGYVLNDYDEIVYMSGIELFGDSCYRIESRTYVPQKFRLKRWSCPHGYAAVQHQMSMIQDCNMWFKSRGAKNKFSNLSYAWKYDGFSHDWQLYKDPVELKWKSNFQWIYYKAVNGNVEHLIDSLRCGVTNDYKHV